MDFYSKIEKFKSALKKANLIDAKKSYIKTIKRLPDISHLKNIVLFSFLASVLILVLFPARFAAIRNYLPKNPLPGGVYEEGVIGRIEQFNPLFSITNSAEQAVTKLVFSGLTKKNGSREIMPDIAERWEVSDNGKNYKFYLKDNISFHDGSKLTAEDVVFTVNLIQNPDVKSPLLSVWKGVDVRNEGENVVVFSLPNPYSSFLHLADFPIVPKHLLETIPPRSIKTSEFSLAPVGSGPFFLKETKKIKDSEEIILESSELYYDKSPFLSRVIIKTYPNERAMVDGYIKREIKGIEKIPVLSAREEENLPKIRSFETSIPNYDVLYFNLRKGISKEKAFREAVSAAINRSKIIEEVYAGKAEVVFAPIIPGYAGYDPGLRPKYDLEIAKKKLLDAGFSLGEDGIFVKGEERLRVSLAVSNDPLKSQLAELVRKELKEIGIELEIERYPVGALIQDKVRPRDFDLLLISQNLGSDSDIYPFWHGTQVNDPGLNLSGFSDRRVDKFLEQARAISSESERTEKYKSAQKLISDEVPAIFLVRPHFRYGVSKEIKGVRVGKLIDPTDRFWDITNWYMKEERSDR